MFISPADIYILSKNETEITESYSLLMENLLHVSSALTSLEMANKAGGSLLGGQSGGGGGNSGAGVSGGIGGQPSPPRPPSSSGLHPAVTITPETSPSSGGADHVHNVPSGLRDTVDIITTL